MPRKKGKKLAIKKSSPEKSPLNVSNYIDRDALKRWLEGVSKQTDYVHDSELEEIISDDERDLTDEFECNLKELEKPLKQLLRRHPDRVVRKKVNLECEWNQCSFETTDEKTYNNHVHDHAVLEDNESSVCHWNLCKVEIDDRNELLRHLDYHAYHTRLKTFGLGLIHTVSIPNCQADSKLRNVIPKTDKDYYCYWEGCSESYSVYPSFLEHVNHHIKADYQTGISVVDNGRQFLRNIKVICSWDECGRELANVFELKRHLKLHTNEKMIGCSNCGSLFATKPLFIHHCIRQVINQRSFQCPDCYKFYPSEKILKDHARSHVNKFQCSFCLLSCQKKSTLARHIHYRHMNIKSFACDECQYKGKTQRDLDAHRKVHKKDNDSLYKCEVFQCNYASQTLMALKRHDAKEHLGQPQTYQCHCCTKKYLRGYLLSKHLKTDHNFKLATGHSRFIYKQDLDGFYRLQTKRVENLKEIAEPIRMVEEDSNVFVSYEIDNITDQLDSRSPINVKMKRVSQLKHVLPIYSEYSTEDSKDINDFAIVKNYKKIIKRKKLEAAES